MKKTIRQSIIITLLLTASIAATACGSKQTSTEAAASPATPAETVAQPTIPSSFTVSTISNNQNTIQVNSTEQVTVTPDIAEVVYAVRTEAGNASDCQQRNSEDVNKVIELLLSLGIAETSIQTSDYYMYPIYTYSNNTQRITGYEATTSLTVSDLPIDQLGNILEQSVAAGINNIRSITYQSSKYDEAYAEALTLAMAAAKEKAEVLAQAGNCTITGVANIRENSNYSEARYTDNALASKMRNYGAVEELATDVSTSIMPGEVDIEVNITVEYFLH